MTGSCVNQKDWCKALYWSWWVSSFRSVIVTRSLRGGAINAIKLVNGRGALRILRTILV